MKSSQDTQIKMRNALNKAAYPIDFAILGSSGRIRTYNPSVNSYPSYGNSNYSRVITSYQESSFTGVWRFFRLSSDPRSDHRRSPD